jgi:RND family efflux transporter MFP subunit
MDRLGVVVERARIDVEQAKKDLETAQRALQAAENQLRVAERNVERRRIVAPIDGMVVAVNTHKGEWVQPGDKVVRIVHTGRLRVEAFVHLDDLPPVLSGQSVILRAEIPTLGPAEFPGAITFVSPEANPVNGQVRVWAEIENHQGQLRPGMSGSLLIRPDSGPPSPVPPAGLQP